MSTLSARAALILALLLAALAPATATASGLPALPHGWPATLQLGLADQPGDAPALHSSVPLGMRYQYLSGGVNRGRDWATYDPDGTFVSRYVKESLKAHTTPVFTYYTLRQSAPGASRRDEGTADLANLRDVKTMRAWY